MEYVAGVMARDLRAAVREIEAFGDEADLWRTLPGQPNAAGNLALHMAGNLRHFIGAALGGSDYVRQRDAEFGSRDVPRGEIVAALHAAIADVERVLPGLSAEAQSARFPLAVGGQQVTTGDFLTHLSAHLAYHLGQLDYLRRGLTGDGTAIGAQAMGELRSAEPVS